MRQEKKFYLALAITISICAAIVLMCYQDVRRNYYILVYNKTEESVNHEIYTSTSQLGTTIAPAPSTASSTELTDNSGDYGTNDTEGLPLEGTETGPTIIELGHSFYDTRRLSEGSLKYTIKNARLVDNISDFCTITGFMYEEFLALNEEHHWEEQELPVYINNDFTVKDTHYFVLVDIIVENQGASCYTTYDLDEDGYSMGRYDDPYLFRADVLYLVNSEVKDSINETSYIYSTIDYFSQKDTNPDYPDNHATYRVEPGETIEFSVGYHFDDETYSTFVPHVNMSKFFVTTTPFVDGYFAQLGLEG